LIFALLVMASIAFYVFRNRISIEGSPKDRRIEGKQTVLCLSFILTYGIRKTIPLIKRKK